MDFGLSAAERAFADEVRGFLRAHPRETFPEDGTGRGYGSGPDSHASHRPRRQPGWPRGRGKAGGGGPEP